MAKVPSKTKGILKKTSPYTTIFYPYAGSIDSLWGNRNQKKKSTKTVRFSPSTICFERETKTYKYHDIFKRDLLSKFPAEAKKIQFDEFLGKEQKTKGGDDDPEKAVSNTYIHFTHAKRLPLDPLRKNSESLARSRKLFALLNELESCHDEYNNLEKGNESLANPKDRDTYLIHEILSRYIVALDLSLTEGCYGITLGLLRTITDTTSSMIPLYSNIFYNLDGSYRELPEPKSEETSLYMPALTPIIYALNRISENRTQTNSGLNMETLFTKLQLELIVLTIAPIETIIFRTVLEQVPATAGAATDYLKTLLSSSSKLWIKWVNNSNLRNDYVGIMKKAELQKGNSNFGCKGMKSKNFQSSDQNNNNNTPL